MKKAPWNETDYNMAAVLRGLAAIWIIRSATIVFGTNMKHIDRITVNPNQCGGRPCIRGMRIRVKDVLELLAANVPEAEILVDFPYLEPEDIRAVLEFAAAQSDHPVLQSID
jgi:uncharacterized protein (DUF433 family)